MNRVEIQLEFKKHIWTVYKKGSFNYLSDKISYNFTQTGSEIIMCIEILSQRDKSHIFKTFSLIMDFLYLALGHMPTIIYYKENDNERSLENFVCRFINSENTIQKEHIIDVTPQTLNEVTLSTIDNKVNNMTLKVYWDFTALTSKAYQDIYAEHKIMLLLHCTEGYINNTKREYRNKKFKDKIKPIVKIFFDNNSSVDILNTLGVNQDKYIDQLTDTRHQYSHFIDKNDSFGTGKEFVFNFFLMHYTFRLYLLNEIGLVPKDNNVAEFYNSMYDWLNTLLDDNFSNYKSVAYSFKKIRF